jgi:hypothetical protein
MLIFPRNPKGGFRFYILLRIQAQIPSTDISNSEFNGNSPELSLVKMLTFYSFSINFLRQIEPVTYSGNRAKALV